MTGHDPMRAVWGLYHSRSGAISTLGKIDMAEFCKRVGTPIGVAYAQRGDLLLCEPEHGERWPFVHPAICLDHRAVTVAHIQGLRYFPALSAMQAFAVGHG